MATVTFVGKDRNMVHRAQVRPRAGISSLDGYNPTDRLLPGSDRLGGGSRNAGPAIAWAYSFGLYRDLHASRYSQKLRTGVRGVGYHEQASQAIDYARDGRVVDSTAREFRRHDTTIMTTFVEVSGRKGLGEGRRSDRSADRQGDPGSRQTQHGACPGRVEKDRGDNRDRGRPLLHGQVLAGKIVFDIDESVELRGRERSLSARHRSCARTTSSTS